MDHLSPTTIRRLRRLPQFPQTVWQGDRLRLNATIANPESPTEPQRADCFVWIDGVEEWVRGVDAVLSSAGVGAIVKSLIKAMEEPLSWPDEPALPQRPERVVVRDRELHFLLRGMLHDLDIAVDYQPELPLVDRLLPGLQQLMGIADELSEDLYEILADKARQLWAIAPWQWLLDSDILTVEIKDFGLTGPLYLSVLGHLGLAPGLLWYRSLDSLTAFRRELTGPRLPSLVEQQAAFLLQDCLFLNYEPRVRLPLSNHPRLVKAPRWEEIDLDFGSISPAEGMRSHLDLAELSILYGSLEALCRFFRKHGSRLEQEVFPSCKSRFKVAIPPKLLPEPETPPLMITVKTQPSLAQALTPRG